MHRLANHAAHRHWSHGGAITSSVCPTNRHAPACRRGIALRIRDARPGRPGEWLAKRRAPTHDRPSMHGRVIRLPAWSRTMDSPITRFDLRATRTSSPVRRACRAVVIRTQPARRLPSRATRLTSRRWHNAKSNGTDTTGNSRIGPLQGAIRPFPFRPRNPVSRSSCARPSRRRLSCFFLEQTRSEGSRAGHEILRFAQDDRGLLRKTGVVVATLPRPRCPRLARHRHRRLRPRLPGRRVPRPSRDPSRRG